MRAFVRMVACAGLLLAFGAASLASEPYKLWIGDSIRLVVLEDPQLSGTYKISESGDVSIPIGRPMRLQGMTVEGATEAVRAVIATRIVDPTVSLDVAQIRPFYITGDVANPGPFPGQVQLTLFKAIAVAGGYRNNGEVYQASINGIRASEALIVARRQLFAAQVQQARLEAELADAQVFYYKPVQPIDSTNVDATAVVERERDLFYVRKSGLDRQLALLATEATVREDEIVALKARIEGTLKQLELLKLEIKTVQDLVDRGLVPISRIYQLSREESQILSVNLQTTVLLNQARQARNQLEIQTTNLRRDRKIEILSLAQEATSTVDKLSRQIVADRQVMEESTAYGFSGSGNQITRTFRIQREDGSVIEDLVDPATIVLPGDVIEVRRAFRQD